MKNSLFALVFSAIAGCGQSPASLAGLDLAAGGEFDLSSAASDQAAFGDANQGADLAAASFDSAVEDAVAPDLATPDLAPASDLAGCVGDDGCGGATPRCDLKTGLCVACTLDGQCPDGQLCRGGACVPGCSLAKGCGDAGACEVDAGACFWCASDHDCAEPAAPRCDVATHHCAPCLPLNDNCAEGRYCVAMNGGFSCAMGCKIDLDCSGSDGGIPSSLCCDHLCIDRASNGANCGQCGKACGNGQSCCNAACDDLAGDPANCGACGNLCKLANATAACAAGKCAIGTCGAGFADCDQLAGDGCEVNTNTDPKNCLGCGKACVVANGVAGCSGGCTVASCNQGFADCDQLAGNGCEIDLTKDLANCGGCGKSCAPANASGSCVAGLCQVLSCAPGFADCNKMAADGCEGDLQNDPKHCGDCNFACAQGQLCTLGKCHAPCDPLFAVDGGSNAAPAIGPDGTVYQIGTDGFLRAFSPVGVVLWTANATLGPGHTNYYAVGGVALDQTQLYAGGPDGDLYAFDYKGHLQWRVTVGGDLSFATPAVGGAALGGAIIVAGYGTFVAAVSPKGKLVWRYTLGGTAWSSSPAIGHDGTIYLATWGDQMLYAIGPDGNLKWKRDNGGGAVTSPAIGKDGRIYTGNHGPSDGQYRAFNPDGTVAWKTPIGNFHGGTAIAGDGTIYAGNDRTLVALNPDGTIKWQASAGGGPEPWVCGGNMVGDDGNIYVTVCGNQTLAVMEPKMGKILCTLQLNGYGSPPTLGQNGVMYVGSTSGKLIGYAGTSHRLDYTSPWPKHHRDIGNTGQVP